MTDTPAAPTTPRFEDVAPDGRRISDVGGELALVQTLAEAMQSKLAKNRGKRHWQDAAPTYLIDRLRQEVEELDQAIGSYLEEGSADEDDVWNEAADVANFAAMLADNATGRAEARASASLDAANAWEAGYQACYERMQAEGRLLPAAGRTPAPATAPGLDVEQIVRAALRVVDQETPLAVGEPLIQRAIRYATNLARLTGEERP